MKITFRLLIAVAFVCVTAYAQNQAPTLEEIFEAMENYKPAPVAEEAPEMPQKNMTKLLPIVTPQEEISKPISEPVNTDATLKNFPSDLYKDNSEREKEGMFSRHSSTTLTREYHAAKKERIKEVDEAWYTEMVFRSYSLSRSICQRIGLEDIKDSTDVAAFFPQVMFPQGSSAIYQPDMQVLFVRNTRKNFTVLEAILRAMDLAKLSADVDQVEIEAKFIEFSQGALEELGFQWNFDDPIGGSGFTVDDGANGLFANGLRGGPSGSSPNLPFAKNDMLGGDGMLPAEGNWSAFGITDTFNSSPDSLSIRGIGADSFELLISALDQSTGTDVLSAPRVTTRVGEEAMIRVGELHSYPEVFEGGSSQATLLNINYRDFREKLLGVELSVTPYLDGEHIVLNLNPEITELAGWRRYQLAPKNSIYNHRYEVSRPTYEHDEIVAKLPIFKKRAIETKVTIADGSTIGMGGLIHEKVESFEDSVPILGRVPLFGRLFRNEGERTVKRNMLIFVTAKKVEPTGMINTSRSIQ